MQGKGGELRYFAPLIRDFGGEIDVVQRRWMRALQQWGQGRHVRNSAGNSEIVSLSLKRLGHRSVRGQLRARNRQHYLHWPGRRCCRVLQAGQTSGIGHQIERSSVVDGIGIHMQGRVRRRGLRLQLRQTECGEGVGLAVTVGECAVLDADRVDADACRGLAGFGRGLCAGGGRRGNLGCHLPVGMTRTVGLQHDVGADQDQTVDFDLARQQREQGQLQFQALQGRHVGARETGRVGERDVLDLDCRPQRRLEGDFAVQRQFSPGGALNRLNDVGLVGVGVQPNKQHGTGAHHDNKDRRYSDRSDAKGAPGWVHFRLTAGWAGGA